jgi:hypothetical protein
MSRLSLLKGHIVRDVRNVSGNVSLVQHDMFAVPINQASFLLTVPEKGVELVVVGGKRKFEERRRIKLIETLVVDSLTYLRVYSSDGSKWAVIAGIDIGSKSEPDGRIVLGREPLQIRNPIISRELNPLYADNNLGLSDEELESTIRAQDRLDQIGRLSAGKIADDIELSFGYGGLRIGTDNIVVRNTSDDKDFEFDVTPIHPYDIQQEYRITTPEYQSQG